MADQLSAHGQVRRKHGTFWNCEQHLALRCFLTDVHHHHVLIYTDNTAVVAIYEAINHLGAGILSTQVLISSGENLASGPGW